MTGPTPPPVTTFVPIGRASAGNQLVSAERKGFQLYLRVAAEEATLGALEALEAPYDFEAPDDPTQPWTVHPDDFAGRIIERTMRLLPSERELRLLAAKDGASREKYFTYHRLRDTDLRLGALADPLDRDRRAAVEEASRVLFARRAALRKKELPEKARTVLLKPVAAARWPCDPVTACVLPGLALLRSKLSVTASAEPFVSGEHLHPARTLRFEVATKKGEDLATEAPLVAGSSARGRLALDEWLARSESWLEVGRREGPGLTAVRDAPLVARGGALVGEVAEDAFPPEDAPKDPRAPLHEPFEVRVRGGWTARASTKARVRLEWTIAEREELPDGGLRLTATTGDQVVVRTLGAPQRRVGAKQLDERWQDGVRRRTDVERPPGLIHTTRREVHPDGLERLEDLFTGVKESAAWRRVRETRDGVLVRELDELRMPGTSESPAMWAAVADEPRRKFNARNDYVKQLVSRRRRVVDAATGRREVRAEDEWRFDYSRTQLHRRWSYEREGPEGERAVLRNLEGRTNLCAHFFGSGVLTPHGILLEVRARESASAPERQVFWGRLYDNPHVGEYGAAEKLRSAKRVDPDGGWHELEARWGDGAAYGRATVRRGDATGTTEETVYVVVDDAAPTFRPANDPGAAPIALDALGPFAGETGFKAAALDAYQAALPWTLDDGQAVEGVLRAQAPDEVEDREHTVTHRCKREVSGKQQATGTLVIWTRDDPERGKFERKTTVALDDEADWELPGGKRHGGRSHRATVERTVEQTRGGLRCEVQIDATHVEHRPLQVDRFFSETRTSERTVTDLTLGARPMVGTVVVRRERTLSADKTGKRRADPDDERPAIALPRSSLKVRYVETLEEVQRERGTCVYAYEHERTEDGQTETWRGSRVRPLGAVYDRALVVGELNEQVTDLAREHEAEWSPYAAAFDGLPQPHLVVEAASTSLAITDTEGRPVGSVTPLDTAPAKGVYHREPLPVATSRPRLHQVGPTLYEGPWLQVDGLRLSTVIDTHRSTVELRVDGFPTVARVSPRGAPARSVEVWGPVHVRGDLAANVPAGVSGWVPSVEPWYGPGARSLVVYTPTMGPHRLTVPGRGWKAYPAIPVEVDLWQDSAPMRPVVWAGEGQDDSDWTKARRAWFTDEEPGLKRDIVAAGGELPPSLRFLVDDPLSARELFYANYDKLRDPLEKALRAAAERSKRHQDDVDRLDGELARLQKGADRDRILARSLRPRVEALQGVRAVHAARAQELTNQLRNPLARLPLLSKEYALEDRLSRPEGAPDEERDPRVLRIPRTREMGVPFALSPIVWIVIPPCGDWPLQPYLLPDQVAIVGFLRGADEPATDDPSLPAERALSLDGDPLARSGIALRVVPRDDPGWTFPCKGPYAGGAVWSGRVTIADNLRVPGEGIKHVEEFKARALRPDGARVDEAIDEDDGLETFLRAVDQEQARRTGPPEAKEYPDGAGGSFVSLGLPLARHRVHFLDLMAVLQGGQMYRAAMNGGMEQEYVACSERLHYLRWRIEERDLYCDATRLTASLEGERWPKSAFVKFDTSTPEKLGDFLGWLLGLLDDIEGAELRLHFARRFRVAGPDGLGLRLLPAELAKTLGAFDAARKDDTFVVDFSDAGRREGEEAAARLRPRLRRPDDADLAAAQAEIEDKLGASQARWLAFQGLRAVIWLMTKAGAKHPLCVRFFHPRNPLFQSLLELLGWGVDELWGQGPAAAGTGATREGATGPRSLEAFGKAWGWLLEPDVVDTARKAADLERKKFEKTRAWREARSRLEGINASADELSRLLEQERGRVEQGDEATWEGKGRRDRIDQLATWAGMGLPTAEDGAVDVDAAKQRLEARRGALAKDTYDQEQREARERAEHRKQQRGMEKDLTAQLVVAPSFDYDEVRRLARTTLTLGLKVRGEVSYRIPVWFLQVKITGALEVSGTVSFAFDYRSAQGAERYLEDLVARNEDGLFMEAMRRGEGWYASSPLLWAQHLAAGTQDRGYHDPVLVLNNDADAAGDDDLWERLVAAVEAQYPAGLALTQLERQRLIDLYKRVGDAAQQERRGDAATHERVVEADDGQGAKVERAVGAPPRPPASAGSLTDAEVAQIQALPRLCLLEKLDVAGDPRLDELTRGLQGDATDSALRYLFVGAGAGVEAQLRALDRAKEARRPPVVLLARRLASKDSRVVERLLKHNLPFDVLEESRLSATGKVSVGGSLEFKLSPIGLDGDLAGGKSSQLGELLEWCEVSLAGVVGLTHSVAFTPGVKLEARTDLAVTVSATALWLEFPFTLLRANLLCLTVPLTASAKREDVKLQTFEGETWFMGEARDMSRPLENLDDVKRLLLDWSAGLRTGGSLPPWLEELGP